eukprot:CAMPEP_0184652888 /NCGR_PEP_ID=MMETSP0308-20130426/10605_1 /TAXON_ID=38269 /ORGANISM="Gloeochaete witrockiana, Strain SAG 46.84" /LENGTH=273 /DNA_ID=CAMNT_0027088041 /DNA_START=24 /DNA_END=848 /DNA_ORIENTATION=+
MKEFNSVRMCFEGTLAFPRISSRSLSFGRSLHGFCDLRKSKFGSRCRPKPFTQWLAQPISVHMSDDLSGKSSKSVKPPQGPRSSKMLHVFRTLLETAVKYAKSQDKNQIARELERAQKAMDIGVFDWEAIGGTNSVSSLEKDLDAKLEIEDDFLNDLFLEDSDEAYFMRIFGRTAVFFALPLVSALLLFPLYTSVIPNTFDLHPPLWVTVLQALFLVLITPASAGYGFFSAQWDDQLEDNSLLGLTNFEKNISDTDNAVTEVMKENDIQMPFT